MVALGPILSLINEDFESLEADFFALKAQIDQANADAELFFTMYDERQRQICFSAHYDYNGHNNL